MVHRAAVIFLRSKQTRLKIYQMNAQCNNSGPIAGILFLTLVNGQGISPPRHAKALPVLNAKSSALLSDLNQNCNAHTLQTC